jgi:hypothetical protein
LLGRTEPILITVGQSVLRIDQHPRVQAYGWSSTSTALLRHFHNRISEVSNALIMIGLGLQIMVAPQVSDYRALDLLSGIVPAGKHRDAFHRGGDGPHCSTDRQRALVGIWALVESGRRACRCVGLVSDVLKSDRCSAG